jgi:5-(carboxyamino)imidazole ribonucleotide mutase
MPAACDIGAIARADRLSTNGLRIAERRLSRGTAITARQPTRFQLPRGIPAAKPPVPFLLAMAGRMTDQPLVGIIMGSRSDWETMHHAADTLTALGVPHEARVVSAHRTPERLYDYAKSAKTRGLKVVIAGAGGAAHLPGMCAAMTPLPVLGVPVESRALKGMDSLLSIVQMPGGVPVATFAIGESGAKNAALHAAAILALSDKALAKRLAAWRARQTDSVAQTPTDK